jgi:hypothetical protein
MTEEEWLSRQSLIPKLRFLDGRATDRKLRLFACGCCRRVWDGLPDRRSRAAVEAAERFADGGLSPHDLRAAHRDARAVVAEIQRRTDGAAWGYALAASDAAYESGFQAALLAPPGALWPPEPGIDPSAADVQVALLGDVFGNPFRPAAFDPRWRTADVLGLARAVYEDRAFGRLPLLADALMDAGCADEQVIGHCRSAGPHVRGCWVVDLVLGKE